MLALIPAVLLVAVLVATAVWVLPGAGAATTATVVAVIVGCVALLAAAEIARLRRRRRRRVLTGGLPGTARIGTLARGARIGRDRVLVRLGLSVGVPGRPAVEVTLRRLLPPARLAGLGPGSVLAVRVEADGTGRVEIDWSAQGTIPGLPPGAGELSGRRLHETVREVGAPAHADVEAVQPDGTGDGDYLGYLLDLSLRIDGGPAYRLRRHAVRVERQHAAKVRSGVTVPARVAQPGPGTLVTVLLWETL